MEVFCINKGQDNKNEALINENIKFDQVLLIDQDGVQVGVIPTSQAMQIANERGYDLVCVAPQAKTPVCKLIDYKKFKYEQQKKARIAKKAKLERKKAKVKLNKQLQQSELKVQEEPFLAPAPF